MRKKGRRLTMLGLLVAVLVWFGVHGFDGESEPAQVGGRGSTAVTISRSTNEPVHDAARADRLWGELRRMDAAIGNGDARAAWSARSRAQGMVPQLGKHDPLRAQFASACKQLREFVIQRLDAAKAELRLGRVLAAAKTIAPLAADGWPLPDEYRADIEVRGLSTVFGRITSTQLPPLPAPIPAGRQVRVDLGGRLELGEVLRSSAHAVTVKLRSDAGVLYPELSGFQLGLVDPGAQEAVDQSLRALHAGDSLLAGLWLTVASDLGAGASGRVAEINRCLGR